MGRLVASSEKAGRERKIGRKRKNEGRLGTEAKEGPKSFSSPGPLGPLSRRRRAHSPAVRGPSGSGDENEAKFLRLPPSLLSRRPYRRAAFFAAFHNLKAWSLEQAISSQWSNAGRVGSSCHNFTKENTDKCRKFHFNRITYRRFCKLELFTLSVY